MSESFRGETPLEPLPDNFLGIDTLRLATTAQRLWTNADLNNAREAFERDGNAWSTIAALPHEEAYEHIQYGGVIMHDLIRRSSRFFGEEADTSPDASIVEQKQLFVDHRVGLIGARLSLLKAGPRVGLDQVSDLRFEWLKKVNHVLGKSGVDGYFNVAADLGTAPNPMEMRYGAALVGLSTISARSR